jgi:hypothetical protein
MERLAAWCEDGLTPEEFESRLLEKHDSEDVGEELLADELLPLWRAVRRGAKLPFE